MKLLPYLLYLLLIAFFRTNLHEVFAIGDIEIYLTPLLVLLVALNKHYLVALWFGAAAGLMFDAPDPRLLGVHMLFLALMGIFAAQMRERFNLDSLKSRVLLVLIGLLAYAIPYTLLYTTSGTSEFFRVIIMIGLPSVVYTTMVAWLFFMFQSGHLSYRKLKSLF